VDYHRALFGPTYSEMLEERAARRTRRREIVSAQRAAVSAYQKQLRRQAHKAAKATAADPKAQPRERLGTLIKRNLVGH
jgi:hypothetical protein